MVLCQCIYLTAHSCVLLAIFTQRVLFADKSYCAQLTHSYVFARSRRLLTWLLVFNRYVIVDIELNVIRCRQSGVREMKECV